MSTNILSKVEPRGSELNTNEWVYNSLCQLILSGEFVPGISFTFRGIANSFGVSTMPVREAAKRLISEGALEMSEKRRITVSQMSQLKFDELKIARLNLETKLSSLALKHIDYKRLKLLKNIDKNLDYAISTGNIEGYIKYNYQFHFGIYEAGSSPVLLPLVRTLWLRFSPFYRIVAGRVGTQTMNDFHNSAINAIIAKDSVALEEAIHNDILEGMEMLNESLNE
jgi:DNA-binding GntR family transcriptional regulator